MDDQQGPTDEQIAAGVKVLRDSGRLDPDELSCDFLIVRRIYSEIIRTGIGQRFPGMRRAAEKGCKSHR